MTWMPAQKRTFLSMFYKKIVCLIVLIDFEIRVFKKTERKI